MQNLVMWLLFGGGFAVALISLIIASFLRKRTPVKLLCGLAILALVLQSLFWWGVNSLGGHSTGSTSDQLPFLMLGVFLGAAFWILFLLTRNFPRSDDENNVS